MKHRPLYIKGQVGRVSHSEWRSAHVCLPMLCGNRALAGTHLGVEATGRLQEQRQVGLDLAAVGVGAVLGLTLQGGDLVLKGMIPPAWKQQSLQLNHKWPTSSNEEATRRTYRSCSTFLSRAYSRSVTSIFWYKSCSACLDVHTSAVPSLESDTNRKWMSDT